MNFVAQTIANQLGGIPRLRLFIAIYNIVDDDNLLQFSFLGSAIADKVRIILTPDDTYTMTFYKKHPEDIENLYHEVEKFEQVYCDQLVDLFEKTTQLYLSF